MSSEMTNEDIDRACAYRAPNQAAWHVVLADDRYMAFRFGPFTGTDVAPIWKQLRNEGIKHLVVCETNGGFDWEIARMTKANSDPNDKLVNLAELLINVLEVTESAYDHTAPDDCLVVEGLCDMCEAKALGRATIAEMRDLIKQAEPRKEWVHESESP